MEKEKKQPDKSPKKRKEEKFSRRELEDLMNMHIDTYTKKNGAWRRK